MNQRIQWDQIEHLIACAVCGGRVRRLSAPNLVQIEHVPTWRLPRAEDAASARANAIAIVCDDCLLEPITHVVEFAAGARDLRGVIVYHPTLGQLARPQKTYRLVREHGQDAILCLVCGAISYSPEDVLNAYCGNCKLFHFFEVRPR